MTMTRPLLERRVLAALDATPRRIPVLLGFCGSGRTSVLMRLRDQFGRSACQYIDVERVATTPERFLQALRADSPFAPPAAAATTSGSARDAFDGLVAFLTGARGGGGTPVTFLLDEVLELRTFESFPGLRSVLRDLVSALAAGQNRFVLTSRYTARALRLLRDAPAQFEIVHVAPLSLAETHGVLAGGSSHSAVEDDFVRAVHALGDGRPAYVHAIAAAAHAIRGHESADPIAALTALLSSGGALFTSCRYCYELRLHRARGYGALKAILEVLALEEPLTLTEIAQRLHRTPGSTKDYLSWLEDVDLVESKQKRYRFADPLLRLWVRLHCRPAPIGDDELAREVHAYALARLPQAGTPPPAPEPAPALAMAGAGGDGIIEID